MVNVSSSSLFLQAASLPLSFLSVVKCNSRETLARLLMQTCCRKEVYTETVVTGDNVMLMKFNKLYIIATHTQKKKNHGDVCGSGLL